MLMQWEYMYVVADRDELFKVNNQIVERVDLPRYMDKLGWDGWELVGVAAESAPGYWRLVFKRTRQPERETEGMNT